MINITPLTDRMDDYLADFEDVQNPFDGSITTSSINLPGILTDLETLGFVEGEDYEIEEVG